MESMEKKEEEENEKIEKMLKLKKELEIRTPDGKNSIIFVHCNLDDGLKTNIPTQNLDFSNAKEVINLMHQEEISPSVSTLELDSKTTTTTTTTITTSTITENVTEMEEFDYYISYLSELTE
jgi:hypothetical protein